MGVWNKRVLGLDGETQKLYLINPRHGSCIDTTVKKLMTFSGVEEIHVTEGEHGFIVMAKVNQSRDATIRSFVQKIRANSRELIVHERYRK
jgi:hypothetical protein